MTQRTRTKRLNSVFESWVDARADIEAINHGEAIQQGDHYLVNGRLYGVEPSGRAYPIRGPGIHELDRRAFQALGVYNTFGLTARAEEILDKMQMSAEARATARRAYEAEYHQR